GISNRFGSSMSVCSCVGAVGTRLQRPRHDARAKNRRSRRLPCQKVARRTCLVRCLAPYFTLWTRLREPPTPSPPFVRSTTGIRSGVLKRTPTGGAVTVGWWYARGLATRVQGVFMNRLFISVLASSFLWLTGITVSAQTVRARI